MVSASPSPLVNRSRQCKPTTSVLAAAILAVVFGQLASSADVNLGQVTVVAGARSTSALNGPRDIAFDSRGNLYVPMVEGERIDVIDPAGTRSTVTSQLGGVVSALPDPRNDDILYCSLYSTNRIVAISVADSQSPAREVASEGLNQPHGMDFYRATNTLYFANFGENRLRSVPASGGASTGVGDSLQKPITVAIPQQAAAMYVLAGTQVFYALLDGSNTTAVAGDPTGGDADGVGLAAKLADPHFAALSPGEQYLFFSDRANSKFRRLDTATYQVDTVFNAAGVELTSGTYERTYQTSSQGRLNMPMGIAFKPAGDGLYVSGFHAVMRMPFTPPPPSEPTEIDLGPVDLVTGSRSSSTDLDGPRGIGFDSKGNLFVAQYEGHRIDRISYEDDRRTLVVRMQFVSWVLPDPRDDNILYCSQQNVNRIAAVNITVGATTTTVTSADVNLPAGIDFYRATNSLYFANYGEGRVRSVPTAGGASVVVGGDLAKPRCVCVMQRGETAIFVMVENQIYRMLLDGSSATAVAAGPVDPHFGTLSPDELYLYFGESSTNRVRRMHTSTYHVATVFNSEGAELTTGTYPSLYPTSLKARLNKPYGVAFYPNGGSLYIAGFHAVMRIRFIPSPVDLGPVSHVVGTVSNGPLDGAPRMAFDSVGNLYLAEWEGQRIWRITGNSANLEPVVANIGAFSDIVVHPLNDELLYCTQFDTSRVMAVNITGSAPSIFYVTTGSLNGPYSIDFDRATDSVYFSNHYEGRVRAVPVSTPGAASVTIGEALTKLRGIGIEQHKASLFCSAGNQIIHIVVGSGLTRVVAGSQAGGDRDGFGQFARMNLVALIALSPDERYLFVADQLNHKFRRMDTSTFEVVVVMNAAGETLTGGYHALYLTSLAVLLKKPAGVAVHPTTGALYVSGTSAVMRVEKIPAPVDIGRVTLVSGGREKGALRSPHGVAFDSAGNLYVAQYEGGRIDRITPSGSRELASASTGVIDVVVDPREDSVLFISRYLSDRVSTVDLANSAEKRVVLADGPYGITLWHASHTLYFANRGEGRVRSVPAMAEATSSTLVGLQLTDPRGIAIDQRTGVFFVTVATQVVRLSLDTVVVAGASGGGDRDGVGVVAAMRELSLAALTPNGAYLYLSDFGAHKVRRMDTTTFEVATVFNSDSIEVTEGDYAAEYATSLEARLNHPLGIAFHPAQNALYIAGFHAVMRINTSFTRPIDLGPVELVAGNRTAGALDGPKGIAFDSTGNLYVAQDSAGHIDRITQSGEVERVVNLTGVSQVLVDVRDDRILYCTQALQNRVVVVNLTTSAVPVVTEITSAGVSGPQGMAHHQPTDMLFFANRLERRIRAVSASARGATSIAVGGLLADPRGVVIRPDGSSLYVTSGNQVVLVDTTSSSRTQAVAGTVAGGDSDGVGLDAAMRTVALAALSPGGGGYLFFCDHQNLKLRRMNTVTYEVVTVFNAAGVPVTAGAYATAYATSLEARLNLPYGVAFSPSGHALYVAGFHAVMRIVLSDRESTPTLDRGTLTPSASMSRSQSSGQSPTVPLSRTEGASGPIPHQPPVSVTLSAVRSNTVMRSPALHQPTATRTADEPVGIEMTSTVTFSIDAEAHATVLPPTDARVRALGLPPTVAATITAAAYGSSAVAAVVSPTMGSKATSAGRVARAAACGAYAGELGGGDDDEWPEPVTFLWLVFSVSTGAQTNGEGGGDGVTPTEANALGRGVGAVLGSAGLNAAAFVLLLVVTRRQRRVAALSWWETAIVAVYTVAVSYLAPSVTSVAVTLLRFAPAAGGVVLWVAGAGGLGVCALAAAPLVRLLTAVRVFTSDGGSDECTSDAGDVTAAGSGGDGTTAALLPGLSVWKRVLASAWDGVRDATLALHRWCVLEDLATAHAIAALEGARPSSIVGCRAVGGAMVLVAVLHMAYLAVVRPYSAAVERVGMLVLGALQCGVAVAAAAVLFTSTTADDADIDGGDSAPDVALALLQLAYDGAVFAVAGLLAIVACKERAHDGEDAATKPHGTAADESRGADDGQAPLLVAPVPVPSGTQHDHRRTSDQSMGKKQTPTAEEVHRRQRNPLRPVDVV